MKKQDKLFKELSFFLKKHFGNRNHFVCVYGSHASSCFTDKSDIDMFIAVDKYDAEDFKKTLSFFLDLHQRSGLSLDDEVPHKNKLIVTYEDIEKAISLQAFEKHGKYYHIPPVIKNDIFLSSPQVRWRLILNALTSPHFCIAGNYNTYENYKKQAEKSLLILAKNLTRKNNPTNEDIIKSLFTGEKGEEGEWYLGYKKGHGEVEQYIKNLVSRNQLDN